MTSPERGTAKERLREQVRREQRLADMVLSAESRLAAEIVKRDVAIAVHDVSVAARRRTLGEALALYLDDAGVSIGRAAVVFDKPKQELTRLLRERRGVAAAVDPPERDPS